MFARIVSRTGVASVARRAFSDAAAPTAMTLNFCTPHSAVYSGKEVAKVTLPGELGEFGITVGHSPIISQLRPGVVSVEHTGGEKEEFFIAGGFSITNAQSVTDISVAEAFPVSDLDEAAIKTGFSAAQSAMSSAENGSKAHAVAQTELNTFQAMARAIGVSM